MAEECRRMHLGTVRLGPDFGLVVGFVRATSGSVPVVRRGSEEVTDASLATAESDEEPTPS